MKSIFAILFFCSVTQVIVHSKEQENLSKTSAAFNNVADLAVKVVVQCLPLRSPFTYLRKNKIGFLSREHNVWYLKEALFRLPKLLKQTKERFTRMEIHISRAGVNKAEISRFNNGVKNISERLGNIIKRVTVDLKFNPDADELERLVKEVEGLSKEESSTESIKRKKERIETLTSKLSQNLSGARIKINEFRLVTVQTQCDLDEIIAEMEVFFPLP